MDRVADGINAFNNGDREAARNLLSQAVREDPQSAQAWYWLSQCVDDPAQQAYCLQRAKRLGWVENEPAVPQPLEFELEPVPPPAEIVPLIPTNADRSKPGGGRKLLGLTIGFIAGFCLCLIVGAVWLYQSGQLDPILAVGNAPSATPAPISLPAIPKPVDTSTPTPRRKISELTPTAPPLTASPVRPIFTRTPFPWETPQADQADPQTIAKLLENKNYAIAVQMLNQAIASRPDQPIYYYQRALGYYHLSDNNRYYQEWQDYHMRAIEDVDRAIAMNVDAYPNGDPYYLRHDIYADLAAQEFYTVDDVYYLHIAMENLTRAIQLGVSKNGAEQYIPLLYFSMYECEQGWQAVEELNHRYGAMAPPSSSMLAILAHGYLCSRDFDKALEYVDRSLSIEDVKERQYLRAVILYNQGRKQELFDNLNAAIEDSPYYGGGRYYIRAYLYLERGEPQRAMQDVMKGEANTWARNGFRSLVLGRLALDNGDREQGIEHLQDAWASMDWRFPAVKDQIEARLRALGVQPVQPTFSVSLQATPMTPFTPAPVRSPTPIVTNSIGLETPPNVRIIEYETGMGPLQMDSNIDPYPYPVYRFTPRQALALKSVQKLVVHLTPATSSEPTVFEAFLWDQKTGEWNLFRPGWGEFAVEQPERFVDADGIVYIAIRLDYESKIAWKELYLVLEAVDAHGNTVLLKPAAGP